ncbi:hypothetical protein R1sor_006681 [Riccia sorocarpa]|uniref:Uncharacterized protein n=1 Tax=Riccia sorocarpa TaxID=122646 RepID=A0ABD3HN51_9MARC
MDSCVQLSDSTFRDIQLLPCEPDGTTTVQSDFLAARWKYVENSIFVNERTELLDREASLLVIPEKVGLWRLKGGRSYVVGGFANEVSASRGVSVLKKSVLDDGASRTVSEWEGRVSDPDLVSGYEAVLQIEGSSELSRLDLSSFEHQVVSLLLDAYDGNVIFELPPVSPDELAKKGGMLAGMDRSNDCWLWTRCVTTSAQIGGKKTNYSVNRIRCVGSLKCVNDLCPFLLKEGTPNQIDWPDKVHCIVPYEHSLSVPYKHHVCGHCGAPPMCEATCDAKMYYITPKHSIDVDTIVHMSRIAIHVGRHCHPHRRVCSRRHVNSVKAAVKETIYSSLHFTPSQVRAAVSNQMFLKMLDGLGAEGLTREENYDLLDSLSPVATPETFTNLIRSIRKSSKEPREESDIISLQQRINFRYVLRSLFIGQAGPDQRAHVFKMSLDGDGSGLALLHPTAGFGYTRLIGSMDLPGSV